MTTIPKNSLTGEARFCRFKSLFEKSKNRPVDCLNFLTKVFSALKALMILIPPKVSSNRDKNQYKKGEFYTETEHDYKGENNGQGIPNDQLQNR